MLMLMHVRQVETGGRMRLESTPQTQPEPSATGEEQSVRPSLSHVANVRMHEVQLFLLFSSPPLFHSFPRTNATYFNYSVPTN